MDVSILICTRNRAASLGETLRSISQVEVPAGWRVDLLVVDNGSSDQTRSVVNQAFLSGRRARFAVEKTPGVAWARNKAVREADGEILLWTDDDVRVPRDWLRRMVSPITEGRMDAVAGGVRLAFGRERFWLSPCLRSWLASSESLSTGRPGRMIGANMAFHRRVLDAVSGFDNALGPGALGMGEETLFSYQIEASGLWIGSAFDCEVEHAFDASRLCVSGMQALAKAMGRSEAYIAHHWHGTLANDAHSSLADATLRLCYWKARARLQRSVPPGLLEGELQALSRVYYWEYLTALRSTPRLYRTPIKRVEEDGPAARWVAGLINGPARRMLFEPNDRHLRGHSDGVERGEADASGLRDVPQTVDREKTSGEVVNLKG